MTNDMCGIETMRMPVNMPDRPVRGGRENELRPVKMADRVPPLQGWVDCLGRVPRALPWAGGLLRLWRDNAAQ